MTKDANITVDKLNKLDLCFEDTSQEHLYDADTIDDFCESIIEDISCEVDCTEFQNTCVEIIEKSKYLGVFEKDCFRMTAGRIKEYIQDYADDNFGTAFDGYEVIFSEKADKLLKEFEAELLNDNSIYTTGKRVGLIDLSGYVKEAIKDYCDENPIV